MWLCMNDGFVSIVDAPYAGKDMLAVRARNRLHLKSLFPDAKIVETPRRDYQFRVIETKSRVADVIADRIRNTGYDNFKASVRDKSLAHAYSVVWDVMLDYAASIGGKSLYIHSTKPLRARY